jgi:hypothetical protein
MALQGLWHAWQIEYTWPNFYRIISQATNTRQQQGSTKDQGGEASLDQGLPWERAPQIGKG